MITNPSLDSARCAAAMDINGDNLDIIKRDFSPKGPVKPSFFTRIYSSNGGGQWFFPSKSIGEFLRDVSQIGEGRFNSSAAAAVSGDGKKLHVFGRGENNNIWHAFSSDGGKSWDWAWEPIINNGVFTSAPAAAVSRDGKKLHVFARGKDNNIWHAFSSKGGKDRAWDWAWEPIVNSGVFTSAPAAAVSGDGKMLHVFARGNDNNIWHAFSSKGGKDRAWDWAWEPIINNGVFTSAPAAAVSGDGKKLHVFACGQGNKIWHAFSSKGGRDRAWDWAWVPIGEGVFSSGPAAVVSGDGERVHVFARGKNLPPTTVDGTSVPRTPDLWRAFSSKGGKNGDWETAWVAISPLAGPDQ